MFNDVTICFSTLLLYKLRPGNIVIFHTPNNCGVEVGMVLTVWKGIKQPKPHLGETPIASCPAFKVAEMEMLSEEDPARWKCSATSTAWVVRVESLVAILSCEKSAFFVEC